MKRTNTAVIRLPSPPPPLKADEAQRTVYGWARAYGFVAEAWMPWLLEAARDVSPGSKTVREDLVQEALVRLWELDPSRFDERDHELVKEELIVRMKQAMRTERRRHGRKRRVEWAKAAKEKPLVGLLQEVDE